MQNTRCLPLDGPSSGSRGAETTPQPCTSNCTHHPARITAQDPRKQRFTLPHASSTGRSTPKELSIFIDIDTISRQIHKPPPKLVGLDRDEGAVCVETTRLPPLETLTTTPSPANEPHGKTRIAHRTSSLPTVHPTHSPEGSSGFVMIDRIVIGLEVAAASRRFHHWMARYRSATTIEAGQGIEHHADRMQWVVRPRSPRGINQRRR